MARPQKYPIELIEKAAARVAAGERVEDVAFELKCDPSGLRRKIKELVPAAREAIAKGVDAGRAVAKLPQSIQRDVRTHIDKLLLLQGVLTILLTLIKWLFNSPVDHRHSARVGLYFFGVICA